MATTRDPCGFARFTRHNLLLGINVYMPHAACARISAVCRIKAIEFVASEKAVWKRHGGKNEDGEYVDLVPGI